MTFAEDAPAKINLFLHVGEKRADGYHALQSLVAFTQVGDRLQFAPADDLRLTISGPFGAALSAGEDNLIIKAARAVQEHLGQTKGAAISLTKNLPVASGIGGGSADCAAALRGLARLWGAALSNEELCRIAARLGSDVPVCIACRPQFMEGRGEVVTPLPALPEMPIVLVNPGVGVSTGKVFAAMGERHGVALPMPPPFAKKMDLIAYLQETGNDMETPACGLAPVISEVIAAIADEGALLSRMSGSGATCFGLFGSDAAAQHAADAILSDHPNWWVVATKLAPLA